MTKDAKARLDAFFDELFSEERKAEHWARMYKSGLMHLIHSTNYDVDTFPLYTRLLGNW